MYPMRHYRMIQVAVFLVSLDFAWCAAHESPPPPPDATLAVDQRLDELLPQLVSDSFIQRDWAFRQIARQGPGVVPRLVSMTQETDGKRAAAVLRLLLQLSRSREAHLAAPALRGVISLQENADRLAPEARELLAAAYEKLVRESLAHLMVFGARIDRDDQQRVVGIIVRSEDFADRHIHWLSPLTSLQRVDLRGAAITDEGLLQLASLAHLEHLNLSDTKITGPGLRQLRTLGELEQLIVYRVPLSVEDLAWLNERLPRCRVTPQTPHTGIPESLSSEPN
jgi:hypothetical protein